MNKDNKNDAETKYSNNYNLFFTDKLKIGNFTD
jgi:hypothetical protein